MGMNAFTNRDHALIVIVQVFLDDFNERSNGPAILRGREVFLAQELILNLHFCESAGQSTYDSFIWDFVHLNPNDDAKIEHEFISFILLILDAHWMAENSILVFRITDRDISIAKGLPRDYVLGHRLEVEEAGLVDSGL